MDMDEGATRALKCEYAGPSTRPTFRWSMEGGGAMPGNFYFFNNNTELFIFNARRSNADRIYCHVQHGLQESTASACIVVGR